MNSHKKNLMSWVTGRAFGLSPAERGAATVVLDDGAHLRSLVDGGWTAPGAVVYMPGDIAEIPGTVVLPYEGSFVDSGSEVQLGGDFFLQVHSYSIAGFLALLGPTAVRVGDEEDVGAFLADADSALQSGTWSDVMTNPSVQLADIGALGGYVPLDGPALRLHVDSDQVVRVSPTGRAIGTLGDGWPDAVTSVPAADEVTQRPWLGRYHSALQALQSLRARGHDVIEVSGFGVRFGDVPSSGVDLAQPLAPVLLRSGGEHYIYVPATSAAFHATPETAHTLERALALPGEGDGSAAWDSAADLIARCVGTPERVSA